MNSNLEFAGINLFFKQSVRKKTRQTVYIASFRISSRLWFFGSSNLINAPKRIGSLTKSYEEYTSSIPAKLSCWSYDLVGDPCAPQINHKTSEEVPYGFQSNYFHLLLMMIKQRIMVTWGWYRLRILKFLNSNKFWSLIH